MVTSLPSSLSLLSKSRIAPLGVSAYGWRGQLIHMGFMGWYFRRNVHVRVAQDQGEEMSYFARTHMRNT